MHATFIFSVVIYNFRLHENKDNSKADFKMHFNSAELFNKPIIIHKKYFIEI